MGRRPRLRPMAHDGSASSIAVVGQGVTRNRASALQRGLSGARNMAGPLGNVMLLRRRMPRASGRTTVLQRSIWSRRWVRDHRGSE